MAAEDAAASDRVSPSAPYYNLGPYQRKVAARNDEARAWVNRGLIWAFAFNHGESERCFLKAIAFDSTCALAHWGVAYALGPNYNVPWDANDQIEDTARRGREALERAKKAAAVTDGALPAERALIEALEHRFPAPGAGKKDTGLLDRRYADAMQKVYERFGDEDIDVAALYADALLNVTPWKLWDLPSGKPMPGARTLEAKAVIDRALEREDGLKHPGLLHLYIHLMEMSPTPEAAQKAADHLRGIVPDSGHLNHMPSHIDVLLGDYHKGMKANQDAIAADALFLSKEGALNFYTLYRLHNYHFRIYCAMFAGQSKAALSSALQLLDAIPEPLLRVQSPPMADWTESFGGVRVHVLVRFGRWDELIDLPVPADPDLYKVTTAMVHYGKGMAYAALGRVAEAEKERATFREAAARVPPTRVLFNNKYQDILQVASAVLDGELEYRKGGHDSAFANLREAINRSRNLNYDEPWGFMQPPGHALGALLLEQGRFEEAVTVYAEDLGISDVLPRALRHPKNVWALHGYHECLVKLGRIEEARAIKPLLDEAVKGADIPIKSSCYCRVAE